jgi:hypothetical protein
VQRFWLLGYDNSKYYLPLLFAFSPLEVSLPTVNEARAGAYKKVLTYIIVMRYTKSSVSEYCSVNIAYSVNVIRQALTTRPYE